MHPNEDYRGRLRSKLTPAQWEEVRLRYLAGETAWALALEFGVSAARIHSRAVRHPL